MKIIITLLFHARAPKYEAKPRALHKNNKNPVAENRLRKFASGVHGSRGLLMSQN